MKPETIWYFFSALAQSAAALTALGAIFVVFSLQLSEEERKRKREVIRVWLDRLNAGGYASSLRTDIEELLRKRLSDRKTDEKTDEAEIFLRDIDMLNKKIKE